MLSTRDQLPKHGVKLFQLALDVTRATWRFRQHTKSEPFISFSGTYTLDKKKSDSPESQLKALGVGWVKRKLAAKIAPTWTIWHRLEQGTEKWNEKMVAAGVFECLNEFPLDGRACQLEEQGYQMTVFCTMQQPGVMKIIAYYNDLPDFKMETTQYLQKDGIKVCSTLTTKSGKRINRTSHYRRLDRK